ncbi:DUF2752 domain-containing protein [Allomuricauda sp. SCSIO 65647]|uniref:DUF2752 domain-containing protein n=1 Tax=Allomuricauda sp. SCSIO 65647 TaxID=2908843 RepID=UPI001F181CC2|nr:DUF2752 domain-containing protein [Muricauda sp. SCSIO 65647]UJH66873.1 DUF2752 domain-containing protein [Muricauda sp. SCSIO 65647]
MCTFCTALLLPGKDLMLPCMSKQILGFDCPGCGLQRSFFLLLEGDFSGAFQMYPAIYFLLTLSIFLIANKLFSIKYANQIIIALGITSVATILVSYIIKLLS